MAAITCTNCGAVLKTKDPIPPGKKVKCPKCNEAFVVPEEEEAAGGADEGIQEDEPKKKRAKASKGGDDDNGDDDTPKKKKGKGGDDGEKKSNKTLIIVLVVVGALFLCCCVCGGVGAVFRGAILAMFGVAEVVTKDVKGFKDFKDIKDFKDDPFKDLSKDAFKDAFKDLSKDIKDTSKDIKDKTKKGKKTSLPPLGPMNIRTEELARAADFDRASDAMNVVQERDPRNDMFNLDGTIHPFAVSAVRGRNFDALPIRYVMFG